MKTTKQTNDPINELRDIDLSHPLGVIGIGGESYINLKAHKQTLQELLDEVEGERDRLHIIGAPKDIQTERENYKTYGKIEALDTIATIIKRKIDEL